MGKCSLGEKATSPTYSRSCFLCFCFSGTRVWYFGLIAGYCPYSYSSPAYSEVSPAAEAKDFFLAELAHSEPHIPLCWCFSSLFYPFCISVGFPTLIHCCKGPALECPSSECCCAPHWQHKCELKNWGGACLDNNSIQGHTLLREIGSSVTSSSLLLLTSSYVKGKFTVLIKGETPDILQNYIFM